MSNRRRDLAIAVVGTVGSRIVWLAAMPIVARLYSPVDVGTWPLVTAIAAIVAVLGTWRLDIAVTIAQYTPRARSLALFTIALTALFSLVTAAAIATFPNSAAMLMSSNMGGLVLLACPAFIVMSNVNAILQAWLLRKKAISVITVGNALNPLVAVCALVMFATVLGPSPEAFVGAQLLGFAIAMIVFFVAAITKGLLDRPLALSPESSLIRLRSIAPIRFMRFPKR